MAKNHEATSGNTGNVKTGHIDELSQLKKKIEKLLNGNGRLTVTQSEHGTPRVRAYVLDDDAGLGYFDYNAYYGLAPSEQTEGAFVLESYFDKGSSNSHYRWKFNPETGTVELIYRCVDDAADEDLGFYTDPGERARYFLPQLRSLLSANKPEDFECQGKHSYAFSQPELA